MSDNYNYQDPEVFYDDDLEDLPPAEAKTEPEQEKTQEHGDEYDPEEVVPKPTTAAAEEETRTDVENDSKNLAEDIFSEDDEPEQLKPIETQDDAYDPEQEIQPDETREVEEYVEPKEVNDINESGIQFDEFSDVDDGEVRIPVKKPVKGRGSRSGNSRRSDSRSQEEGSGNETRGKGKKRQSQPRKEADKCEHLYAAFPFMKKQSFTKKMADLEQSADDRVSNLLNQMSAAIREDLKAIDRDEAAFAKLELLPKVLDFARRKYNHKAMFESGILQELRGFLEPTSCGVLPDIKIQYELLTLLEELPIKINMLRGSFIGRVVEFYTRTPRATKRIKEAAKSLKKKWTDMATQRAMGKKMTNVDPEKVRLARESFKRNMPSETVQSLRKTMKRIKKENSLR